MIHTPGHAANHLCLVLEEDGLLFSGDHVLNGSTTVVDPPDGNMNAYLESLDLLDAACAEGGIEFILPAHGYVLGDARAARSPPQGAPPAARGQDRAPPCASCRQGTPEDWLPLAYDDVPERMWPVAARSLAAHVERIRELARPRTAMITKTDEGIRLAKRVAALAGCSRREAELLIENGAVRVDGEPALLPQARVQRAAGRRDRGRRAARAGGAGHPAAAQARRHCDRRRAPPAGARQPP